MASLGMLAAGVAHEIHNPISFVHSNPGTLGEYLDDMMTMIAKYEAAEGLTDGEADPLEEIRLFKTRIHFDDLRNDLPALLAESSEGLMRVRQIVLDLQDFSRVGSLEEWIWADIHQGLESTLNMLMHELQYKCEVRK